MILLNDRYRGQTVKVQCPRYKHDNYDVFSFARAHISDENPLDSVLNSLCDENPRFSGIKSVI